jgi:hypothetical protein
LATGSAPGIPAQVGHTAVFGGAETESTTAHPQNIFERVRSSAWTSRPMTGSYSGVMLAILSMLLSFCDQIIQIESKQQPYAKMKLNVGKHGMPFYVERIAMPNKIKMRDR